MNDITTRLESVRARIASAAAVAGRPPDHITLLAVSKAQPADSVRAARAAGQADFGENYLAEALDKIAAVPDARWHFIGRVQSNKTREIAERFDWVHTLDRLRIAERLSRQRPVHLPPLQACIQVNISGETTKGGVPPGDCAALAESIAALPCIRLRGLMAMPAPGLDASALRRSFAQTRGILDALNARGLALDTLSMGMSADIEAAILEGATIVRVGTAIFGPRE